MALTDRQKNSIIENLKGKVKGGCPLCGARNWNMADELCAVPATSLGGGMAIGGPMIPMIQVICTNCGFVAHHAVGALGINLS